MAAGTSSDKDDMRGILSQFPTHCREAAKLGTSIVFSQNFESIAVFGMGGSAIGGDLIRNILVDTKLPVYTVRDYNLPNYINSKTLVFATSYSGNTEESIAAYEAAMKRNCSIVTISSGGELEAMAHRNATPHIKVPPGIQPRMATAYLFIPILNVLKNSGIANVSEADISSTINFVGKTNFSKIGEQVAKKIYKKIPIIYASTRFSAVAMKWKTDINENAKVHAFYNVYPEFNHNEINAYESKDSRFFAVILKDGNEHPRIEKRMKITADLMKKRGVDSTEVVLPGISMLDKVVAGQYLGLWVSFWLAMMYKINPTPVKIIEDLKKQLKD